MFSCRIWVIVVVTLVVASSSYSQAPQPVEQLTVVDANGKRVGRVMGIDHLSNHVTPIVVLKLNQLPISLSVTRSGFQIPGSEILWESLDCSGPAFLFFDSPSASSESLFQPGAVGYPGQTVYTTLPGGEPRVIRVGSGSVRFPGQPSSALCWQPSVVWEPTVVPARAVIDLNTQFTAPYSLR